jgi:O-antigen/teichoic acid export membrane protein
MTTTPSGENRQTLLRRGIAWNSLYQIFHAGTHFAAMLVLVRVIPPAEYGRAAAVVGLLALLNTLNCQAFLSHALQEPEGTEPDWSLHWSAGFYIQGALSLACHAMAGLLWFIDSYRPLAALMHLAALGFLLDWPSQVGLTMLRRAMDFRRMRLLSSINVFVKLLTILALGLAGAGAYAIVLGSNVLLGLGFAIDLLLIRRWRPSAGWWQWPDWKAYRPALRFGMQQAAAGLLAGGRGALEAAVLPGAFGFVTMGLWNRAQALYATTAGRAGSVLVETVYPLLPRSAADGLRYLRHATLFLQGVLWIALPAAVFLGLEGPQLSRLVYGNKWLAADPLLWPGAVAGLGLAAWGAGSAVMLAANRLRACFQLDVLAACTAAGALAVIWTGGGMGRYAWAVAGAQLLLAVVALGRAADLLRPDWSRVVVWPALAGSLAGVAAVLLWRDRAGIWPPPVSVLGSIAVFAAAYLVTVRILFPGPLFDLVERLPGAPRVKGWLRLPPAEAKT